MLGHINICILRVSTHNHVSHSTRPKHRVTQHSSPIHYSLQEMTTSMASDSKPPPSFSIPRPRHLDTSRSTSSPNPTNPNFFVTPSADDFQRTFNPNNHLPHPTFLTTPAGR